MYISETITHSIPKKTHKENKMLNENNNKIKLYGVIIGLVTLAAQHGFYLLGHILALLLKTPSFCPKIDAIDGLIPLIPVFIIPYIWSYVYWGMAPMVASKCEKEHYKDYLAAYLFSCIAGMIVLAILPTTLDRNAEGIYDTVKYNGFFADIMRLWYKLDGAEIAYNLFPSFHCLNSTISYLGVAGRKEVPLAFRIYSLVITIVIYCSTLLVKQHYFVDVISGVGIALIVFIICKKTHAGRIFNKPIEFFKNKFAKKGEKNV